ncbi:transcription initiation factor TFIID [Salix suchowensis]|nr:transcription initiation factor TFIID [Salix suchowensis]
MQNYEDLKTKLIIHFKIQEFVSRRQIFIFFFFFSQNVPSVSFFLYQFSHINCPYSITKQNLNPKGYYCWASSKPIAIPSQQSFDHEASEREERCHDIVAEGQIQEGRSFFNSFREDHEMMDSQDLQKLEGVLSPSHLESKCTIILGIVIDHINFQGSSGQPISISDDPDAVALIGSSQDPANQINKKEIFWGLLEDSLEELLEKTGVFLSDSEKTEGETKEGGHGWEQGIMLIKSCFSSIISKRSIDGGKRGASIKKSKRMKLLVQQLKLSVLRLAPQVKPELPFPVIYFLDPNLFLRNHVQMSGATLPSFSFYTFVNTHNVLNCTSISHDGSLIACGFSDSSLKGEYDTGPSELGQSPNSGKRYHTFFQGHLGPVNLSSSADTTDRYILLDYHFTADFSLSLCKHGIWLWRTELNANFVDYKGHNYPVWDVQVLIGTSHFIMIQFYYFHNTKWSCFTSHVFTLNCWCSPVGHYLASASHDRTARMWSMHGIQPLRIMVGHLSDVDVMLAMACQLQLCIPSGSSDKTVRLWDVQSGERVRIFIGHRSMILSLAMSPDGRRHMASADEDGTIKTWDLSSGRCISPLIGHNSCVCCEGSLLASGSADCSVKLWDATTTTKAARRTEERIFEGFRSRCMQGPGENSSPPLYLLRNSHRKATGEKTCTEEGIFRGFRIGVSTTTTNEQKQSSTKQEEGASCCRVWGLGPGVAKVRAAI